MCARKKVPRENGSISKRPIGPFHMIVRTFCSASAKRRIEAGPMSSPAHPAGISCTGTILISASGETLLATTQSTGR